MAESFLFSIAESLIQKLASSAFQQASRVIGVYDDLHEFKNTLSYVKAVLLDADQKKDQPHELQEWLRQIKHVFSDAENLLDEFQYETLRKRVVKAHGSIKTKVGGFFSSSNPLVFRYRMAKQIKDIKKRLDKVASDRNKFGLQIFDVDRHVVHKREMTYSVINDSDVIGREHDKEKIIQSLVQQSPCDDDPSLSVIPIVGMGGLGKTTLAKFVFNDSRINESFPLKMWVCVSDEFDIKQLIVKIINSAAATPDPQLNVKELDMEQLTSHLRNKLADQKFLLVLDDVWNEDRAKWIELRNLIEVGAQGSKILVTTRSHSIASMMGTMPSHILEGLSLDDSMSLFKKWAFKEGEEEKHPTLIEVGTEIMKKCGGVPLALRTIGSMLFSKVEIHEWEYVRDNEIWNLPQKKDDILPALKLSYDQLPSHLRQCFAIFSLYPKDYQFQSFEVTPLWAALGLLPSPNKNTSMIEASNQYLFELMSRSFLQEFINSSPGFYSFHIHDLMHDLALYVVKDECLMVNSNIQETPENLQHLSFVETNLLDEFVTPNSVSVRTIIFPIGGVGASSEAFLNMCLSRYKYLRILDLSDSTYETLPWSIGKLRHLRYLNLSYNETIKRLPNSICKLLNLLVLDLSGCTELEMLPKGLGNLVSLQRLTVTTKQLVFPENDIANLSALEFLFIDSCENLEVLFVGIKLPSLRVFVVHNCGSLKSMPLDINHFPLLEILQIDECVNLELSKGYDSQKSILRLKSIFLVSLPQLVTLPCWLQGSSNTLHSLVIYDCENLEVLPEWLSTFSFLKSFSIDYCRKLMSLPYDIHCLTALECLKIGYHCPELCRKYQPQVGEYWPKISHIKVVEIYKPKDLVEVPWEGEEELEEEEETKEGL